MWFRNTRRLLRYYRCLFSRPPQDTYEETGIPHAQFGRISNDPRYEPPLKRHFLIEWMVNTVVFVVGAVLLCSGMVLSLFSALWEDLLYDY